MNMWQPCDNCGVPTQEGMLCPDCQDEPGSVPDLAIEGDITDKVSEASQVLLANPERLVETVLAMKDLILAFDERLTAVERMLKP